MSDTPKWTEFSFVLKPSKLGGIGVFAAHDLPKDIEVLSGEYKPRTLKIKNVPPHLLIYCIYLNEEECLCPERFDRMDIGWYLNHSETPNLVRKSATEYDLFTLREIKAGEEVLVNYNQLNEPENLKEAYYSNSK